MIRQVSRQSLLRATRLLMAAGVVWVVLPAIDMPGGYMGGADVLTRFGLWYSIGLAAVVAALLVGVLRRSSWASIGSGITYSLNIAVFVPAFAADPVPAALVAIWQLVALGAEILTTDGPRRRNIASPALGDRERLHSEGIRRWYGTFGPAVRHGLAGSLILTLVVVGYGVSGRVSAFAICSGVLLASFAGAAPWVYLEIKQRDWWTLLLVVPFVVLGFVGPTWNGVLVAGAVDGLLLLTMLFARSPLFRELLSYFYSFPSLLLAGSFGAVISVGVLLLTLPAASTQAGSISAIDALFTSTSATCVTGLIVLDTPHAFTMFGEAVILSLIQVGGLGIMVISTFGAVILGQRLGLSGEQAVGELFETEGARNVYDLTVFVIRTTLLVEAIGAALLTLGYMRQGYALAASVWRGVFHAISAFCNAGFALQTNSLVPFQGDPLIVGTVAVLVVVGGLGFVALATVWTWMRSESSTRAEFETHTRLALSATVILVGVAALVFGAFEWNASLGNLPVGDKLINAVFQSITLRTAGFNTVAFDSLRSATLIVMMVWMFIGGAPGSTAGGVKVTTITILFGAVRAFTSERRDVVFFGRRVPPEVVYRSLAIVGLAGGVLTVGATALFLVEDLPFRMALFEVVSAFGTVGLSLGATGELAAAGKLVIIVLMFLGRIGPLSFALLLGEHEGADFDYPDGRIMVG